MSGCGKNANSEENIIRFFYREIYWGTMCNGDENYVATFRLYFLLMNSPVACTLCMFIV